MGICSVECFCGSKVVVICLVVIGSLVGCGRGREKGVCILLVCVGVVCCCSGDVDCRCCVIDLCVQGWSSWGSRGGGCGWGEVRISGVVRCCDRVVLDVG